MKYRKLTEEIVEAWEFADPEEKSKLVKALQRALEIISSRAFDENLPESASEPKKPDPPRFFPS